MANTIRQMANGRLLKIVIENMSAKKNNILIM